MADYHFVSRWQIQAPIERVWDEIYHAERWPSWWKYVDSVQELEPGGSDGVGARFRLVFRTALPYALGFDVGLTSVRPPRTLVAEATGELEGTGRWTLTPAEGGTLVRYDWDIRTTRWWMNLLAPLARPAFRWNHDQLMREGGESLARRLGADLLLPDGTPRPSRPVRAGPWIVLGVALAILGLLGWRRRTRTSRG
jgi:Polyketide cyclase / dehydrase and lipid transport